MLKTMEGSAPGLERRSAPRHSVELPVLFQGGRGVTRDVSRTGLYFVTSSLLEEGQSVQVSLSLPHIYPEREVGLTYLGTVRRVERLETGRDGTFDRGVAVAAHEFGLSTE